MRCMWVVIKAVNFYSFSEIDRVKVDLYDFIPCFDTTSTDKHKWPPLFVLNTN
jgi:hypothetical protein